MLPDALECTLMPFLSAVDVTTVASSSWTKITVDLFYVHPFEPATINLESRPPRPGEGGRGRLHIMGPIRWPHRLRSTAL